MLTDLCRNGRAIVTLAVALVLAMGVHAQDKDTTCYEVRATKYHPGMGGAGWVTASGARIDNRRLKAYEIRWVALSPDMFRECGFRMGDTINVVSERVEKLNGKWVVKDKMGPRTRRRIDFLLPKGDNYRFTAPTKVSISRCIPTDAKP